MDIKNIKKIATKIVTLIKLETMDFYPDKNKLGFKEYQNALIKYYDFQLTICGIFTSAIMNIILITNEITEIQLISNFTDILLKEVNRMKEKYGD